MTFLHLVGKCVWGRAAPMPVAVSAPGRGIGASSAARPVRLASAAVPSENPADAKKCRRVIASTYCWKGVMGCLRRAAGVSRLLCGGRRTAGSRRPLAGLLVQHLVEVQQL